MNIKPSSRSFVAFVVLGMVILACGAPSIPNTSIPAPTATAPSVTLSAQSVQGTYDTSGTSPNGSKYTGTLSLALNDSYTGNGAKIDVYDATWGDGSVGAGILIDNLLATSFGGGKCGAVFYAIGSDMSLTGLWLAVDTKKIGTENNTPTEARTTLAGNYTVSGTNADQSAYTGTLTLTQQGDVWQLKWDIGGSTIDGVGINVGTLFAAAYGGDGCGVGLYKAESDNSLTGVWALWGFQQSGTESAIKQ